MLEIPPFTTYNLAIGLVTGLGVLSFLVFKETVVDYHRSLITITGLLVFLIGEPLTEIVFSEYVHWVHGVAATLVVAGLYDTLQRDFHRDVWSELLLRSSDQVRQPAEWMLPIDDAILELFHATDLVLTPSIIAYNIDYRRGEANRRLAELERRGFVEKVERGKYRLTILGTQYIEEPISSGLSERLRYLWKTDFETRET